MGSAGLKRILKRETRGIKASMLLLKLEAGLRKRWESRQQRRDDRKDVCHVSTLLGENFCARQAYYKTVHGEWQLIREAPHSMSKLMIFFDGDTVEAQLSEMLKFAGVERLELKQLKMVETISGTPDFGISFMGNPWIIECKSLHSMAWRKMEEPTKKYVQQVVSYMMLYGIPRSIVTVKGKDVSDWKFFEVRLDDQREIAEEMARRMMAVSKGLKSEVPPRRYCEQPTDTKAKRCPFAKECFGKDARIP
jgi:hypothetical protein